MNSATPLCTVPGPHEYSLPGIINSPTCYVHYRILINSTAPCFARAPLLVTNMVYHWAVHAATLASFRPLCLEPLSDRRRPRVAGAFSKKNVVRTWTERLYDRFFSSFLCKLIKQNKINATKKNETIELKLSSRVQNHEIYLFYSFIDKGKSKWV
jgi:hypothetical protein